MPPSDLRSHHSRLSLYAVSPQGWAKRCEAQGDQFPPFPGTQPLPPRALGPGPPRTAGQEEDAAGPCPEAPSSCTQSPPPALPAPVASLGARRVPPAFLRTAPREPRFPDPRARGESRGRQAVRRRIRGEALWCGAAPRAPGAGCGPASPSCSSSASSAGKVGGGGGVCVRA